MKISNISYVRPLAITLLLSVICVFIYMPGAQRGSAGRGGAAGRGDHAKQSGRQGKPGEKDKSGKPGEAGKPGETGKPGEKDKSGKADKTKPVLDPAALITEIQANIPKLETSISNAMKTLKEKDLTKEDAKNLNKCNKRLQRMIYVFDNLNTFTQSLPEDAETTK